MPKRNLKQNYGTQTQTQNKQTNKHVSTQSVSPTLLQSKSTWPPRTKLTGKLASTATYDHTIGHCMYKSHVITYTLSSGATALQGLGRQILYTGYKCSKRNLLTSCSSALSFWLR